MLVYDSDRIVPWVAERLPIPQPVVWYDAKAIGRQDSAGNLIAGVVYENFSVCDVNMHVASEGANWLTRAFLVRVFWYPFVECDLRRVTFLVPAKHSRALRFNLHLGAKVEGIARHAMPDDDLIILGMLREECRYIGGNR